MLNLIKTNSLERATYSKGFCKKAMNASRWSGKLKTNIYVCDGSIQDKRICSELSPGVLYMFYKNPRGNFVPIRLTYSNQTKKNIIRGCNRFWGKLGYDDLGWSKKKYIEELAKSLNYDL